MKKKKQTAQEKYLLKRGFKTRAEYFSYLYRLKRDEAQLLRKALKTFIAAVKAIPTPREEAIRKRKRKP